MRTSAWASGLAATAVALSLAVAACGSSGDEGNGNGSGNTGKTEGAGDASGKTSGDAKRGGKLTVLWAGDVDFIDCGRSYYQMGIFICNATQRQLYTYKTDNATDMQPDIAEGPPEVSEDGKTVTVKIKSGIKYSPPYQDHTVTSADIKYAIERGFFNSVASGFVQTYFTDLVGSKVNVKSGTDISGIETPDDQTVIFKFKRGVGGMMASGALAYISTSPVPKAYAEKFDAENPSTYGENQLATGPYMIENDPSGKAIGYEPGKRIHLVRNPSWDAKSDTLRPAYLDEVDNLQGNDDPGVSSRRILTGQAMINGDFAPLPENLKDALDNHKGQLVLAPPAGTRYVSMNTTVKPFDDMNIRKAVSAGMDRNALLLTRGGKTVGDVATHYLPPGMAGFDEAGGMEGPNPDFLSSSGAPNPEASAKYFKDAGFASGKYEGTDKILMVGSNVGVAAKTAEVTREQFEKMGFKVTLRLVQPNTMYTRYCNTPSANVAVCPNVAWNKDFADGQVMLSPTFNGKNILEQGNSNWPELDVPAVNDAMDKAEVLPKDQRPAAWGAIDKQVVDQAAAIPWDWEKTPLLQSANVAGVVSASNNFWDISSTSLK